MIDTDPRATMVGAALDMARRRLKWEHQGRDAALGVDCIGVPTEAARAAGFSPPQRANYSRHSTGPADLVECLLESCVRIGEDDLLPADVIQFQFTVRAGGQRHDHPHVGVYVGTSTDGVRRMVHATEESGEVCLVDVDERWERRIVGFWRLRELEGVD